GFNESFAGPDGLAEFEKNLGSFLAELKELKYPSHTYGVGRFEPKNQDQQGEVKVVPQVVLVSPIANEDLKNQLVTAATQNNPNLQAYTAAMKKIADANGIRFVDVFSPTKKLLDDPATDLTVNGVHLTEAGDQA